MLAVTALKRRMSGGSGRRLSIPMADREHALHDKDIDDTLHDTSLLRTQMKLVEKKDFTNEASSTPPNPNNDQLGPQNSFLCQIRGTRDITNFLEKSEVLLDVKEEELDSIVERLLDVMMQEKYGEAVSREELTSLIFANPERTLLSEFVQGTIHKGMNQYEWEQVRTKLDEEQKSRRI